MTHGFTYTGLGAVGLIEVNAKRVDSLDSPSTPSPPQPLQFSRSPLPRETPRSPPR